MIGRVQPKVIDRHAMPSFRPRSTRISSPLACQCCSLLLGVLLAPAASAQWFGTAALEAIGTDNVSRSPLASHADDDQSLQASVLGGYHWQLADYTGFELQGALARQQSRRFAGLSNTRATASATLNHKFGLGELAPSLSLTSSVERSTYNNAARDAWSWIHSIDYRQRLNGRLSINLRAGYEQQNGDWSWPKAVAAPAMPKSGDVWDTDAFILNAGGELDLGPASWLSASLGYRDGDTVASVLPYSYILNEATAVTMDSAFGPGVVAYRLDASTRSAALDWNYALRDTATFYVGIERQFTRSYHSLDYRTSIVRTGLLYSF